MTMEALTDDDRPTTEQLREEIAQVRQEFSENVEAVAERLDPKGMAREKIDEAKAKTKVKAQETARKVAIPVAAGVVALTVLVALVKLRRRRRSR